MPKKGKKYLAALEKVDRTKKYSVKEAVDLLKKISFEKFDAGVECAIRLNLDPRQADQNLRGAFVLPHGTGKVKRVAVFAQGDKAKDAKEAGADIVGAEDLAEKILAGFEDFDVIVASPDMMAVVGKLGRTLGPKGLMPNPKDGTVTADIGKAVEEIKGGKVSYRVDKVGNMHAIVGKVNFDAAKLVENIQAFYDTMVKARPSTVKGTFVKNIAIASTMGPGIILDPDSIM
jgi:large subunit ribosomal protein L1